MVISTRIMIIQRPAAKSHFILKHNAIRDISLSNDIFTAHSSGFSFSRQKSQKIQFPLICIILSGILDIIPGTGSQTYQLVSEYFGILYGIAVATHLQIPEILRIIIDIHGTVRHIFITEFFPPGRGYVRNLFLRLPALNQTAHAHSHAIRLFGSGIFPKFCFCLPTDPKCSAAQRCQNTVTGAVAEVVCPDFIKALGSHLIAGNRADLPISAVGELTGFCIRIHTGTIKK